MFNVPFKVKKSKNNRIQINVNDLNHNTSSIRENIKRDAYDDLLIELRENENKSHNNT